MRDERGFPRSRSGNLQLRLGHSPSNPTLMGKKHLTPLYPTQPTSRVMDIEDDHLKCILLRMYQPFTFYHLYRVYQVFCSLRNRLNFSPSKAFPILKKGLNRSRSAVFLCHQFFGFAFSSFGATGV